MRLELKHFGRHAELRIAPRRPDAVLVAGRNRSGKTTVRDAVEFALLGTCALRGFALKKDVARYMIHETATRATVTLGVAGWAIRRSITSTGTQKVELDRNGNGGFVAVSAAELEAFLPALRDPFAVRCALESDHFWRHPAERGAMLVSIAGKRSSAEEILAAFSDLVRDGASRVLHGQTKLATLADLAAATGFPFANGSAVEARRTVKRDRAAIEVGPPVEVVVIDGTDPRLDPLDAMRRGLGEARAELANAEASAQRDLGRLVERLAVAEQARGIADDEWMEVSRTLWRDFPRSPWAEGEEVGPTAILDAEEIVKTALPYRSAIEAAQGEAERVRDRLAEIEAEVPAIGRPSRPAERELPKLCPAVEFVFDCPVAHGEFREAREAAKAKAEAEAKANASKLVKHRAALAEESNSLRVTLNAIDARIAEAKAKAQTILDRARLREELGERTLACKRMVDLRTREVEQAKEALRKAEKAPSPEVLDGFRAQVARLEAVVAERERYDRETAAQAQRQKDADRLDFEVEWWDAVEKELRPDGIERRLANDGADRLRRTLAEAEPYFGVIDLDASFDISIDGRHVASASKSEQRCAGVALQRAVAGAIGLPLVVVDEVDALDGQWRRRFIAYAHDVVAPSGTQLLAMATVGTDARPNRPPDGFVTAWLTPGQVEMIESVGGES